MRLQSDDAQGVYEAGSMKKGTQLPWSDFDVVLFVTDFRPEVQFFMQRFQVVISCLREEFGGQMINVVEAKRFCRSFEIIEGLQTIKFDILLGYRPTWPRDFISWDRDTRQAMSASSAPFLSAVRHGTPAAGTHESRSNGGA